MLYRIIYWQGTLIGWVQTTWKVPKLRCNCDSSMNSSSLIKLVVLETLHLSDTSITENRKDSTFSNFELFCSIFSSQIHRPIRTRSASSQIRFENQRKTAAKIFDVMLFLVANAEIESASTAPIDFRNPDRLQIMPFVILRWGTRPARSQNEVKSTFLKYGYFSAKFWMKTKLYRSALNGKWKFIAACQRMFKFKHKQTYNEMPRMGLSSMLFVSFRICRVFRVPETVAFEEVLKTPRLWPLKRC